MARNLHRVLYLRSTIPFHLRGPTPFFEVVEIQPMRSASGASKIARVL